MAFGNNEEKKKKLKPAKTISTSLNAADKIVKKVDPSASKKSAFSQSNSPEKAVGRTRTSVSSWMKPKNRVSEKVWYKGSEPTETETLAQILKISETDNATAEQAYKFYEQAKAEGTWKETYDKATSPYLTALGIEDPSQVNDEFFAANADLFDAGVHTSTGALSSAKKNGPGAMLAYNLSGLYSDYNATKELKAEQDRIVAEAQYWMNKGLSDDEIKAKLNIGGEGSKYKKIGSALDSAKLGKFTPTTDRIWAATSWGVDGMLWSLRNPEQSTGDYFHDAVQKDMGRGKAYAVDPAAAAKRDRSSTAWAPYSNGTTMDDEAIRFGVTDFSPDWAEKNRAAILASGDEDAIKAFGKVMEAEEFTKQAEEQAVLFREEIENAIELGLSPDEVFYEGLFDDEEYSALRKLYEGYMVGVPAAVTRGIDFDLAEMREQASAAYELKQAQQNVAKDPASMQTAVEAEKQAQIEANGSLINTDTVPKSLTAQNTSVFAQPPEKTFRQGLLWASARTMTDVLPQQVDYLQDVETKPQSAPYQLAGAYSEWTDDQKYAAQNYISDSRGGHDTSDAVQEMKDAGLTDEQINTFRSQMTDALGSGDYTDELMDAWFEPVEAQPDSYTYGEINTAIQNGDLPGALNMMEVNFDKKVAEDPELLNTENAAKASVAMLGLAAESGVLADPEQQEHAAAIADTVIASMNMAEDGGFYMWLDNVLNYNGTLIDAAQNNPGWGLNNTLMWAMDHTAETITDLADKFIGYAINGIGRAVGSEELAQKGEEIANEMTARVAGHSDLLMQNGTPLEILGGQALSETVKMATFGKASQFLNAGTAIAFGEKWKWLTKAISGSPFALESGVREFDEAYQETSGDYMTSLLSGMAGFASTAIMSRWDGILKNIEAQGSPFLREVVEKVGFFNGAGVKATVARWGKAGSMWLWNLAKTAVNEAVQEPAENVLTTFLTDAVKGENPLDRDWEAYGKELIADGAMAAIISLGSSVSTMAPYANSVKVVESQLGKPNLTGQDVQDFVTAITQDAQNPQLAEDATNRANAIAVEVRAGEIAAETGAQGADGSQLAAAQEKVEAAGEKVAETDAAVKQANQEMQTANERLNENPGDQQAAAAFTAAAQKKLSADQADQKAQNVLLKAISDRDATQEAVQAESQIAMDAIRTQAAAEVEERTQEIRKFNYSDIDTETNIQSVADMGSVVTLNGDEFVMGGTGLRQQIVDFYDRIGGMVHNDTLGDIALTKSGVKSSIGHNMQPRKVLAFAAVPDVIENGQVINIGENWKGRGYDTFVIAAPISVASGENAGDYFCGVIVKRTSDRQQYYVHDVILEENKKQELPVPTQPGGRTDEPSVVPGSTSAPTLYSLLEKVRDVKNQRMTPPDQGVSQFAAQTGQRTSVLSDSVKKQLEESPFYNKTTEKKNVELAVSSIEREGYETRRNKLLDGSVNLYTPEGQVEAYVLAKVAKDTGDAEGESAIAFKVKESGTLLGQSLAMRRMYIEMTPEGKAQFIQRIVDQINQNYANRKKNTRVEAPAWLVERLEQAEGNDEQIAKVIDDAYAAIAEQMPPDWKSRMDAWRYTAMLANPRTHIRNFAGNLLFMPAISVKNKIGALAELTVSQDQRTKSIAPVNQEYKDFAKKQLDAVSDVLTGGGKHNPMNEIQSKRRTFNSPILEWLSTKNGAALEAEDAFFLNKHFINALAGFLQARGVDTKNVDKKTLQEGLDYAILEAQKATYRDASEIADQLSKFSNGLSNSRKRSARAFGLIVEGALPFKKTPVNVMRRGIEYSPVGLLSTLSIGLHDMKRGNITQADFIDRLASGLTGTGLAAIGAMLYSLGHLKLSLDEPEDELEKLNGSQEYSVELFGKSITIDWLSPSAMPLFVGGAIAELFEKDSEGFSFKTVLDAMMNIAEPVFNLSMLDGVNSLLSSASYGENGVVGLATNAAESYATQFVPSILGAFSRVIDPVRRTTYTEKDSGIPDGIQYVIDSTINKLPWASKTGQPYLNAWGEEDFTSDATRRVFENFISPGYINDLTNDDVETALMELFDITGNEALLPKLPAKYFTVDKQRKNLTGEEYEQLTRERGQTAKTLHEYLFGNPAFLSMPAEYQAYAIQQVWDYATQRAKNGVAPNFKMDSWVQSAKDPAASIMERTQSKMKKDRADQMKNDLYDAIDAGEFDTAATYAQGVLDGGTKKDSLRTSIANQYKAQYKAMYEAGDVEGMRELEAILLGLPVGFKVANIRKWIRSEEE